MTEWEKEVGRSLMIKLKLDSKVNGRALQENAVGEGGRWRQRWVEDDTHNPNRKQVRKSDYGPTNK